MSDMTQLAGGLAGNTFGLPASELEDLSKALGTGTFVGNSVGEGYVDGGAPFRVQSLESILKIVSFQDRNIVFWKNVPKQMAFNTSEEYNRLVSYGDDASGFFKEGDVPAENDSQYERKQVLIKFMGETGIVTHAMTLVRSAHGDVIGREAKNRTLNLLKKVEVALFQGDSNLNPFSFDGLEKAIMDHMAIAPQAENVVDLRGDALNEETMEDISRIVADNYGYMTHFYAGNKALTDLSKQILPNGRFSMPYGDKEGRLGFRVRFFDSQVGSYELIPNVFLKPGAAPKIAANVHAPAAATSISLSAAPAAGSLFEGTATIYYAVSSVSTSGESLVTAAVSTSVAAGDGVAITVSNLPAGTTAFKIYRGTSALTLKEMKMVKAPAVAGVIHTDLNEDLPGHAKAYGIMMDGEQGLAFKQLAPLMKMDLATVATSYRFMILLYGALAVYAPQRMVLIKNIGSL